MLKNQLKMLFYEESIKILHSLDVVINNLLHGSLKENIVFLHFYKCGGTSISQAIKSCYLDLKLRKKVLNKSPKPEAYRKSIITQ